MRWRSTEDRYGPVAIGFHWLSACALLLLFVSGFWMANTENPGLRLILLRAHALFGVSIVALTILRIFWWIFDRKPAGLPTAGHWQEKMARLVHRLMYIFILVLGASGFGMLIVSGAKDIVLGSSLDLLPDFDRIRPHVPHMIAVRLLIASSALHVFAALYHQFILQDRIMARIGLRTK